MLFVFNKKTKIAGGQTHEKHSPILEREGSMLSMTRAPRQIISRLVDGLHLSFHGGHRLMRCCANSFTPFTPSLPKRFAFSGVLLYSFFRRFIRNMQNGSFFGTFPDVFTSQKFLSPRSLERQQQSRGARGAGGRRRQQGLVLQISDLRAYLRMYLYRKLAFFIFWTNRVAQGPRISPHW